MRNDHRRPDVIFIVNEENEKFVSTQLSDESDLNRAFRFVRRLNRVDTGKNGHARCRGRSVLVP